MFRKLFPFIILAFVLAAPNRGSAAPTPEWQVTFGTTGKVPVSPDSKPRLQRDPASDGFYLNNVGQWILPTLAAKLDATGKPVWSAFERMIFHDLRQNFTVLADGSTVTQHGDVTRRAADGSFAWSVPSEEFEVPIVVEVAEGMLMISPLTTVLSRLDPGTGTRTERLRSAALRSCYEGEVAKHGNDVYWFVGCNGVPQLSKIRLSPLGIEWTVDVDGIQGWTWSSFSALTANPDGVQIAWSGIGGSRIASFAATTGQRLWMVKGAHGDKPGVVSDIDGDPIVFGDSIVEKLDRTTGERRWLHSVTGTVNDATVAPAGIVITGAADASSAAAFVERLARADGASEWRHLLSIPAMEWVNATSVAIQSDHVLVAGVACAANARPERCDVVLWPRDMAGTGSAATVPQFDAPASGRAARAAADTTIAAALEYGPDGMQLRVKRVRNDNGMVLWDVVRPTSLPKVPGRLPASIDLAVNETVEGQVAVLYRPNFQYFLAHSSDAVVAVFDTVTGAFRWERSVVDTTGGYTDGLVEYVGIDSAGNVFVSSNEAVVVDHQPMTQSRRQIRRYAAAAGVPLLDMPFAISPLWNGTSLSAPLFRVVGNDILVEGLPLSYEDYATTRISGSSGAVQWSNAELPFPYPWGYSILDGAHGYVAGGYEQVVVAAVDYDPGTISWTTSYSDAQDLSYAVATAYRGNDGALYAGGIRRIPRPGSSPSAWDSRGLLLKVGATGGIEWVNRFDATPVTSTSGTALPVLDHDGVLYSWQREARSVDSPGYFYTATSTSDGSLRGTQAVYFGDYPFPHLGQGASTIEVVGTAGDGGTVVQGYFGDSSQPYTFGVAGWPAPQPFAGGALRVALSTAVQSLDGEIATSFVLEAVNDGTVDAPDVDALLALPAGASVGPVDCMVGVVPCNAKITPMSIGHRLDLPAGARVRLTGSMRNPRYDGARVEASAFAPYGFVEMDMKDNIRSVRLDTVLFRHGFD